MAASNWLRWVASVRTYHNRLELLQEGAERIVELLGADRAKGRPGTLSVSRRIEVYEHGLATPTISRQGSR